MVMEVKITTKKLADIMMANYKEEVPMLSDSAESEIRRLLGDEFVNEAYTEFKNTVVLSGPNAQCKGCIHCHPVKDPYGSGWSLSQGFCDLLRAKVRLNGLCGDTKREGGAE